MPNPLQSSLIWDRVPNMKHREIREKVAREIRAAIARDGRSPSAIADEAGISRSAMSRKLRGRVPFWTEELLTIAAVLNVEPGAFLPQTPAQVAA